MRSTVVRDLPHELSLRVASQLAHDKVKGKGGKLFNTHDGNLVLQALVFAAFCKVIVHLQEMLFKIRLHIQQYENQTCTVHGKTQPPSGLIIPNLHI